jgi:hypothetical protein
MTTLGRILDVPFIISIPAARVIRITEGNISPNPPSGGSIHCITPETEKF